MRAFPPHPSHTLQPRKQMRTELNERGSQCRDHVVSSRTMRSESCLPFAAEQCDLEKGLVVSEPVALGIKHVGQTLFNRHA